MRRLLPRWTSRAVLRCLAAVSLSAAGTASAQARRAPPAPHPPAKPPTPTPAQPAAAKSVEVTVFEVAGGRAYLQPGAQGAVRRNATVTLKGKEYRVVQASDSYAVIELGDEPVREKDKGRASIVPEEEDRPTELPPPRPVSTWQNAWTAEEAPAGAQQPRYVPIGEQERNRKYDVTVTLASGGIVPLRNQPGSSLFFLQLGARVHAEPWAAPAAFDFDGSLQQWAAADLSSRVGGTTRSWLWVRELLASYGTGGWYAGLGRMKYAASTLGTLDGARVQAPLGEGFSVGAFGGFLPNPLGGEVSLDAQRFGMEARFHRPDLDVRPEAALVVHGSTFGGALDERRVSGMFGLYPGPSRFGGHFEVSAFDPNNPWKASPVEVTAAGLDQSVRVGSFEFGGRFDILQPERSRWLATFLPSSWFCKTVPAGGGASPVGEPCDGASTTRGLGSISASVILGDVSLAVGGTAMVEVPQTDAEPRVLGVFASGRIVRIFKVLRLEGSASYSNATYMDMFGGSAGPGISLIDNALDVGAYYRIAAIQYASLPSNVLENAVGGTAVLFPSSTMMFTLQGEGITGNDVSSLFLFGTVAWRPRL
jgi:hypothetical protein